jgi:hypothetical protein
MTTRLVQVDLTKTMLVRLPADEAEAVLSDGACSTDLAERLARWQRIAHYSPHHFAGDLNVSDAADVRLDDWTWPEPVAEEERARARERSTRQVPERVVEFDQ